MYTYTYVKVYTVSICAIKTCVYYIPTVLSISNLQPLCSPFQMLHAKGGLLVPQDLSFSDMCPSPPREK